MSPAIPSIKFPTFPLKGKISTTKLVQICTETLERDAALIEHIGQPDIIKQLKTGGGSGRRWALIMIYNYKLEIARYVTLCHLELIECVPTEIREALMVSPLEKRLTPQEGYKLRNAMGEIKDIVELERRRVQTLGSDYVQYMPAEIREALMVSPVTTQLTDEQHTELRDAMQAVKRLTLEAEYGKGKTPSVKRSRGRSPQKAAKAEHDRIERNRRKQPKGQKPQKGQRAA